MIRGTSITSLGWVTERAALVALVLTTISPATPASADPPARCEAGVGFQAVIPTFDLNYATNYLPPIQYTTGTGGTAGQQLALTPGGGPGLEIGVACFPTAHVGVQVLTSWGWLDLPGVSSPYAFRFEFTMPMYPTYVLTPVVISASKPWPDTTGSLNQFGLSVNGIYRTGERHGVSATISGGLTWQRTSAAIEPVAYTVGHIGGHSTFFTEEFRLRLAAEPATEVGFNIGGDLRFALGEHALAALTYRYVRTGAVSMPMTVNAVVNADQIIFEQTLEEIQAGLKPPPLTFTPSFSRIGASFLVRF